MPRSYVWPTRATRDFLTRCIRRGIIWWYTSYGLPITLNCVQSVHNGLVSTVPMKCVLQTTETFWAAWMGIYWYLISFPRHATKSLDGKAQRTDKTLFGRRAFGSIFGKVHFVIYLLIKNKINRLWKTFVFCIFFYPYQPCISCSRIWLRDESFVFLAELLLMTILELWNCGLTWTPSLILRCKQQNPLRFIVSWSLHVKICSQMDKDYRSQSVLNI
jgi:hypothetical protein